MRVLVFVKDIAGAAHRASPDATPIPSADTELNRIDAFAVAEASRIAGGDEVVAATVGSDGAVWSLREALALGASRAVHVSETDASTRDALATARILAALAERERAPLVLLGREAADTRGGIVPAMVAELLHRPLIAAADRLIVEHGSVRARQRSPEGSMTVSAPLPLVASISEYGAEIPEIDLAAARHAFGAPIDRLTAADLGLRPPRARAIVRGAAEPQRVGRAARRIEAGERAEIARVFAGLGLLRTDIGETR